MSSRDISLDCARQCVRRHVKNLSAAARVVPCRTGKFNTTFFIEQDHGPDHVLRIAPPDDAGMLFYERNMMAQEPGVHRLVRAKTSVPAPRILAYDTRREIIDRDFLIMERMPGVPLTEAFFLGPEGVHDVFRQVGEHLAQVHAIHAEQYGYLGEHRCMAPQPTWRQAFSEMWRKIIDDAAHCGGYSGEDAECMRRVLDQHQPAFDREVPSSLLHMDIWHQNILVANDGIVSGLIDWDRALWGDPEIEFAVLDYCGVSVPEFWQGYGAARAQSPEAAIRNRFYLLYEVQKYILIAICRRQSLSQAAAYRRTAFELIRPLLNG